MTNPFGTSLRRDPADPRGLRDRIDSVILERLEEAIDSACLEVLVALRRAGNRPPPAADRAEDRAEFEALVRAFLERLASIATALGAAERRCLGPAPRGARDADAKGLAFQVSLARLLPDYWQRFEAVKAEFAAGDQRAPGGRAGLLRRLLGRA